MQHSYYTSDLGLASYLALSFPLEGMNRADPNRVQFCFAHEDGIDAAVECYWRGIARVDPLALLTSQKTLKHRLYDQR